MFRKRESTGECTYCGRVGQVELDHVPPANLIPSKAGLVTVPSCRDCNGGASKDDEYFRTVLLMKDDTGEHPIAEFLRPKVLRAIADPVRGGLRDLLLGEAREVELRTEAGLYVGRTVQYQVNLCRLGRVIERTVKGLFRHHQGHRLPDSHVVQVLFGEAARMAPREPQDASYAVAKKLAEKTPFIVQDGRAHILRHDPMSISNS